MARISFLIATILSLAAVATADARPRVVARVAASDCSTTKGPHSRCRTTRIGISEYLHWARIYRRSSAMNPRIEVDVRQEAMRTLIGWVWLRAEAAGRSVVVADDEVRREFESVKAEGYPTEEDYRAFLRRTGYTEADLLRMVHMRLLGVRLRQHVIAPANGDPEHEERLMARFEHRYFRVWRSRTTCASRYRVEGWCAPRRR